MLNSPNTSGVPVHPTGTDPKFVRWSNGTTGIVASIHPESGWYEISAAGGSGWVLRKYLTVLELEEEEVSENEIPVRVVGTWNLEWLKDGKSRGFPENTRGGPSYGPRTDADYAYIADVIRNRLMAALLVLTEINGKTAANGETRSPELDRLTTKLGSDWQYRIGTSGGSQRVVFLFDTERVRLDAVFEIVVPEERIGRSPTDRSPKDIFDRDPLVGRFTLLCAEGNPKNDFVVVGLHLASGQHLNANHNRAMAVLAIRLRQEVTAGRIPAQEKDFLIMGDFNADRYDSKYREDFWTDYMKSHYDIETLSPPDGAEYPGTRLTGVPLYPGSKIDYIMASSIPGGMFDDLTHTVATVHTNLLPADFNEFRKRASDHLPVTVGVMVVADDD